MTWLQTAGIVAGSILAIAALLTGAWHVIRAMVHTQDLLKRIGDQLVPNGGASLRDAVNRIECHVNELNGRLDEHIHNGGDQQT